MDTDFRCPQCHQKFEQGFIPTGGGMHWHRRKDGSTDFAESIPGTHTWLRRARLPAWRCKRCHLVMFRYGYALDPETGQHVVERSSEEAPLETETDSEEATTAER